MESNENSNSNSNSDTEKTNEEKKQVPSTSSKLPKRSRMDPCVASTSMESGTGNTNAEIINSDSDGDSDTNENKQKNISEKNENISFEITEAPQNHRHDRFAKRSYRKRSQSNSSSSSSLGLGIIAHDYETVAAAAARDSSTSTGAAAAAITNNNEPAADSGSDSNEELPQIVLPISGDSMSSSEEEDANESDDSADSASSSVESTDDSSDNEEKVKKVLEKPKPICDLNLVRNLIYRQSAEMYNGQRKMSDRFSNGFIRKINNSIYSVERLTLMHKMEKHHGCVNCLNFNKGGNLLVTGSDDLKVIVWNWAKNVPISIQVTGHRSNIFQSKFVENGSATNQTDFSLITSARDGEVRHIKVAPDGSSSGRLVTRHTHYAVHKIAIPDSNPNEILTAGEDGSVMRSDLREKTSEKLVCLRSSGDATKLYSIAMHPFDPEFCVCGQDEYVRVYDRRNVKNYSKRFCPSTINQHKKYLSITCAVYNNLGTEILASYGDENIYLFDTQDTTEGSYLHAYSGHKNHQTIKGVNFFGPNSEFVMSGSDCGNFFIWDKKTEAIVQWLRGDKSGVVNCLEGHPNFPIIATSGLDHNIKIWSPMNPDGRPNAENLKKCVKRNLNPSRDFVRRYVRNLARLVNDRGLQPDNSSVEDSTDSDDDDDDDDEDDAHTIYRPGGPCEVQ